MQIDADEIVRAVNAQTGGQLSVQGVASEGKTGGAIYVGWPDGHEGVVTPSDLSLSELRRAADVLALASSRGIPVPRYDLIVPLADGSTVVVQERMPGAVGPLDVARLEAMVETNERFAGVLAGRRDVPIPRLLEHETAYRTLEEYSDRSRDLLTRIRQLGRVEMRGDDLVHADFNPENVLFDDDGSVTGVVDWAGCICRGDRHFALVKLRFLLAWDTLFPPGRDPAVLARLDELLDDLIEPETLLGYWAHWSLAMVDFTFRTARPVDVELHLDVATSRLT